MSNEVPKEQGSLINRSPSFTRTPFLKKAAPFAAVLIAQAILIVYCCFKGAAERPFAPLVLSFIASYVPSVLAVINGKAGTPAAALGILLSLGGVFRVYNETASFGRGLTVLLCFAAALILIAILRKLSEKSSVPVCCAVAAGAAVLTVFLLRGRFFDSYMYRYIYIFNCGLRVGSLFIAAALLLFVRIYTDGQLSDLKKTLFAGGFSAVLFVALFFCGDAVPAFTLVMIYLLFEICFIRSKKVLIPLLSAAVLTAGAAAVFAEMVYAGDETICRFGVTGYRVIRMVCDFLRPASIPGDLYITDVFSLGFGGVKDFLLGPGKENVYVGSYALDAVSHFGVPFVFAAFVCCGVIVGWTVKECRRGRLPKVSAVLTAAVMLPAFFALIGLTGFAVLPEAMPPFFRSDVAYSVLVLTVLSRVMSGPSEKAVFAGETGKDRHKSLSFDRLWTGVTVAVAGTALLTFFAMIESECGLLFILMSYLFFTAAFILLNSVRTVYCTVKSPDTERERIDICAVVFGVLQGIMTVLWFFAYEDAPYVSSFGRGVKELFEREYILLFAVPISWLIMDTIQDRIEQAVRKKTVLRSVGDYLERMALRVRSAAENMSEDGTCVSFTVTDDVGS